MSASSITGQSVSGYTGNYDIANFTPLDNTGWYDFFRSGYKNIRFNISSFQRTTLDGTTAYNLPGLVYNVYGDTSLWRALLAYNGLNDPLSDIYPGQILNLPDKATLVAYLANSISNNQSTITV